MSRPGQHGAVVWPNELYNRHHHQQQGQPNYFTRKLLENPPKIETAKTYGLKPVNQKQSH